MDLFVIICKVNVNCFVLDKWLARFVISNVNVFTDPYLGSCGRKLCFLQDNWLIYIHLTRCGNHDTLMCQGVGDGGLVSAYLNHTMY